MDPTALVLIFVEKRSIVPVSAWLTESKPSCFSRVFYYCHEKRHPCIKSGNFGTYYHTSGDLFSRSGSREDYIKIGSLPAKSGDLRSDIIIL